MRTLRAWLRGTFGLFGGARHDRALIDELDAHLQAHIDDNVRAGMTLDHARRHALLSLGGVEMTKDNYRNNEAFRLWTRWPARCDRRSSVSGAAPGFALAAILSLAARHRRERFDLYRCGTRRRESVAVFGLRPAGHARFRHALEEIPAGFNSITARQYFFYGRSRQHSRQPGRVSHRRSDLRTRYSERDPDRPHAPGASRSVLAKRAVSRRLAPS